MGFLDKMGLKAGHVELELERVNWQAGETIRGEFRFNLKRAVKAKSITVGLRSFHGTLTPDKTPPYEFEVAIAGEGKYQTGKLPFEILIPEDVVGPGGVIGKIGKAMQFVRRPSSAAHKLKWEVWATIRSSGSPGAKVQITVSPPGPSKAKSGRRAAPPSTFGSYQPPPLPVRKKKPPEPEEVEPEPKAKKGKGKGKKSKAAEAEVVEVEEAKPPKPKKKKKLRHFAPPAIERPDLSRLNIPAPSYDTLPRRGDE